MLRDYFPLNDKSSSLKDFKVNLLIIAGMFIVAIFFLKKLPDQIPIMHDGPRQIYVNSMLGVFLIPAIALGTNILLSLQKRLYPFHSIIYILALLGMSFYYYTLI